MKKYLLMAALLCGTSFASMAGTAKSVTPKVRKPNYAILFSMCGQTTIAIGKDRAEALEVVAALAEAYC
ncbi:hypothetical protein [uncultured Hymenobacter sp.]|uniref:hypothetical protein n=1 Tax=uncultured Hymenobacter sp. TaxID=170016 RepID=UPI0035CA47A8